MEFSGQECWSGLSFPSPSNVPNPVTEPGSPGLSFPFPSDVPDPGIEPGSPGLSFPSPSDAADPGTESGSPGLSFPSPNNVPNPGTEPGSPGLSFPSPSDVPDPGIEPGSPGLSFPFPSNVPDPGTEPGSPALQAGSLLLSHQGSSFKTYCVYCRILSRAGAITYAGKDATENQHIFLSSQVIIHFITAQYFCYCCSVAQSCLTLCNPHELQHARPPCPSPSPRVCPSSCPLHR